MDIFEKQQTIEAIRTVVKARWFYLSAIALQAVIVKIFFPGIPLASGSLVSLVIFFVFVANFSYWFYLRRPTEKISDSVLKIIKFSQVPLEQLGLTAIIFFSGTANKLLIMMYILTIMIGSVLYKARGVVLATASAVFIYSGLIFLDYFGLMPEVLPEAISQSPYKILKGNLLLTKGHLIGSVLYLIAAALYAGFLASLFRKREKRLQNQRDELSIKSNSLTVQTQELTRTKDYLHEALTKSDKARMDLEHTKAQLEKANLELKAKLEELEKYGEVTTGRELKMIELKEKIKTLEQRVNELEKK